MSYRHQDRRRHADDEMEVDQKRRRGPETQHELERRVVDLIMQIGDKPGSTSLESNIEKLVTLLEGELEKIGEKIIYTVAECAKHLPDKLTIYSTLVGLLNAKNYNFGGEIVEKLVCELQAMLEKESFRHAVNLVTFICDLGNCRVLSLTSVVEFLEGLLEAAAEDGIPQVRSDWFVYAILRSLPWIGLELVEKKSEELDNLLGGIEQYMQQRSKAHYKMLQVWTGAHEQEEYLDCIYEQIKLLASVGWQEKHIARLYIAFDSSLSDALQHNLPTLAPPPHRPDSKYPMPYVVFRLFDYADCPEDGPVLPGAHSIERHLIEDELGWIVDLNELNRRDCAEALLAYTRKDSVPLAYVVLEAIFGRMFALPESPQPRLFYGALLIELCRLQPNTFPQVLAQSAELLYERSGDMQPVCLDRFIDWFSYHLSNFQYRWSWQDWADCLEADDLDPKLILAREVLEKCVRFAYYERIAEVLPETHARLLPPKPEIVYPLEDEAHEEYSRAKHFQALFQEKLSAEAMLDELRVKTEDDQPTEGAQAEYDPTAFAVFFAVLLKLASKSFSHNFAALTRYHRTLKYVVADSEEMQHTLMNTLHGCWRNNAQMLLILVDKLLKMQILDCAVVVQWIFEETREVHARQWVWEMLNTSLLKLGRHVAKTKRDLEDLRRESERSKKEAERKRTEEAGEGEGGTGAGQEGTGGEEADEKKVRVKREDERMEDSSSAREEAGDMVDKVGEAEQEDVALVAKEAEVSALVESQRNIFLDVFLKFAVALSEKVRDEGEEAVKSLWFAFFQGRMRHVFLEHNVSLVEFAPALQQHIFSNEEIDPRVVQVFKEYLALRA